MECKTWANYPRLENKDIPNLERIFALARNPETDLDKPVMYDWTVTYNKELNHYVLQNNMDKALMVSTNLFDAAKVVYVNRTHGDDWALMDEFLVNEDRESEEVEKGLTLALAEAKKQTN